MALHSSSAVLLVLACTSQALAQDAKAEEAASFLQAAVEMQLLKGVANGVGDAAVKMPTCRAPTGPGSMPEEGACMPEETQATAAPTKKVASPTPRATNDDLPGLAAYYMCFIVAGVLMSMALQRATRKEACSEMLEAGAKACEMDSWGRTPLHEAAAQGSVTLMTQLLDTGASVDCQDGFDETPLHAAARAGQAAMCELLLQRGAAVNTSNEENETPLLLAARAGQRQACKVLLDHGGNTPGIRDEEMPPLLSSLMVQRIFADLGERPEMPEAASDVSDGPSDQEQ